MQEQETSVFLRDHFSGMGGFDDDFASEVELTEEEFSKLRVNFNHSASMSKEIE